MPIADEAKIAAEGMDTPIVQSQMPLVAREASVGPREPGSGTAVSPMGAGSAPLAARDARPSDFPEGSHAQSATSSPVAENAQAESPPDYIFALGRIVPRFPSLGIEKEF